MTPIKLPKKIIIAGPCAVENHEQVLESMKQAKILQIDFLRLSLWKPRTKPGFEGVGEEGIFYVIEAATAGVNPAVEPILIEHAQQVADAFLKVKNNTKLLFWIGARNQNHYIQRGIASVAAKDPRIFLMVKNQIWHNEKHWEGIVEHVLDGGLPKERLLLCHRGFAPLSDNNPRGYRNVPDFDMAMRMKEKTGLPMLFDPSHTGGSVEKVFTIAHEANQHAFDGYIIEVHPNPKAALSDSTQQLTWGEYKKLMKQLYDARLQKVSMNRINV